MNIPIEIEGETPPPPKIPKSPSTSSAITTAPEQPSGIDFDQIENQLLERGIQPKPGPKSKKIAYLKRVKRKEETIASVQKEYLPNTAVDDNLDKNQQLNAPPRPLKQPPMGQST